MFSEENVYFANAKLSATMLGCWVVVVKVFWVVAYLQFSMIFWSLGLSLYCLQVENANPDHLE